MVDAWLSLLRRIRSVLPLWVVGLCLVLVATPLSTKVAGVAWAGIVVWGAATAIRRWRLPRRDALASGTDTTAWPAARAWLIGTGLALTLSSIEAVIWPAPFDELNAQLRLAMAGAAVAVLVRSGSSLREWRRQVLVALAASCGVALVLMGTLFLANPALARDMLPANALPWTLAVAFSICLLCPVLLETTGRCLVALRLGSVIAGMAAIGLSQSRAAMVVFPWAVLLVGWWLVRSLHITSRLRLWAAGGVLAAVALVIAAWVHPDDPLRNQQAGAEVAAAVAQGNYNSSLGVRVYLWNLAIDGIRESPWIGIGGAERLRRIKSAGEGLDATRYEGLAHVRSMGHVHNNYLHAALDGGLLGLGSLLSLLGGLCAAAWQLRRHDRIAAAQLAGVAFVHGVASLTNVNFAHNYYVVTLATAVSLALLCAGRRQAATATHP